jgi:predicted PurR-regulated permease PerM
MQTIILESNHLVRACWICFLALTLLFIGLGLVKFIVFLLFIYLANELLLDLLHKYLPFLSKKILLYFTALIFLVLTTILITFVLPTFIKDLPQYVNKFYESFNSQFNLIIQYFDISYDILELKIKLFAWFRGNIAQTISYIQRVSMNVFLLIIALIINFVIHYNIIQNNNKRIYTDNTLLSYFSAFASNKIRSFYNHFKTVMSAQLIISLINTTLTLGILVVLQIPHKITLMVLVFVFGLLPVIGNIISNTIICSAAFIWSGLWQVVAALIFLVGIHKLEYFLNSKIIGHFTSMPIYITLLALLIGEMLFHISGMIIAIPTILFIREELRAIQIHTKPTK